MRGLGVGAAVLRVGGARDGEGGRTVLANVATFAAAAATVCHAISIAAKGLLVAAGANLALLAAPTAGARAIVSHSAKRTCAMAVADVNWVARVVFAVSASVLARARTATAFAIVRCVAVAARTGIQRIASVRTSAAAADRAALCRGLVIHAHGAIMHLATGAVPYLSRNLAEFTVKSWDTRTAAGRADPMIATLIT